jgi:hypothetical protein
MSLNTESLTTHYDYNKIDMQRLITLSVKMHDGFSETKEKEKVSVTVANHLLILLSGALLIAALFVSR